MFYVPYAKNTYIAQDLFYAVRNVTKKCKKKVYCKASSYINIQQKIKFNPDTCPMLKIVKNIFIL